MFLGHGESGEIIKLEAAILLMAMCGVAVIEMK